MPHGYYIPTEEQTHDQGIQIEAPRIHREQRVAQYDYYVIIVTRKGEDQIPGLPSETDYAPQGPAGGQIYAAGPEEHVYYVIQPTIEAHTYVPGVHGNIPQDQHQMELREMEVDVPAPDVNPDGEFYTPPPLAPRKGIHSTRSSSTMTRAVMEGDQALASMIHAARSPPHPKTSTTLAKTQDGIGEEYGDATNAESSEVDSNAETIEEIRGRDEISSEAVRQWFAKRIAENRQTISYKPAKK